MLEWLLYLHKGGSSLNSTIQASFLYSHLTDSLVEDTHFKSITRLKSSSPENYLETLFLNMTNNKVDISKESITTYLNTHISTHFFNEDLIEDIEEHLIRHNDNFLLFTFNPTDESLAIKYLTHTEILPTIYSPIFTSNNALRECACFEEISSEVVKNSKKNKKPLFKNIFGVFKKKNSDKVEA